MLVGTCPLSPLLKCFMSFPDARQMASHAIAHGSSISAERADPEQGHAICMIQSGGKKQMLCPSVWNSKRTISASKISYQMFYHKCFQQNHNYIYIYTRLWVSGSFFIKLMGWPKQSNLISDVFGWCSRQAQNEHCVPGVMVENGCFTIGLGESWCCEVASNGPLWLTVANMQTLKTTYQISKSSTALSLTRPPFGSLILVRSSRLFWGETSAKLPACWAGSRWTIRSHHWTLGTFELRAPWWPVWVGVGW